MEPQKKPRSKWSLTIIGMLLFVFSALFLAMVLPCIVPVRTVSATNACINHLRQLDGAKEQYVLEHFVTNRITFEMDQLIGARNYIKKPVKCPAGGTYVLGGIGEKPLCSVKGHKLP